MVFREAQFIAVRSLRVMDIQKDCLWGSKLKRLCSSDAPLDAKQIFWSGYDSKMPSIGEDENENWGHHEVHPCKSLGSSHEVRP